MRGNRIDGAEAGNVEMNEYVHDVEFVTVDEGSNNDAGPSEKPPAGR